jgi:hypothetical protein
MKHKYILVLSFLLLAVMGVSAQREVKRSSSLSKIMKTQAAVEQRLDSILYIYESGEGPYRDTYTYQDETTIVEKYYDFENGEWGKSVYRDEYTYDNQGRVLTQIESFENETHSWKYKYETEYEGRGILPLRRFEHEWDYSSNNWITNYKWEYIYNEDMLVYSKEYERQNGELQEYSMCEYSGTWDNLEIFGYYKDGDKWELGYKELMAFNSDFNMTLFIGYDDNDAGLDYQESYKTEWIYNSDGSLSEEIEWYKSNGQWIEEDRDVYNYKNGYIETINRYYEGELYRTAYYFYSNITSINSFNNESRISIYPNPTTGIIKINTIEDTVTTVYNTNGMKFLQSKEKEIDLTGYANGIYILDINGEKAKVIKK